MSRKKAGARNGRQDFGGLAVGYVRVSTAAQGTSGFSLDAQRAAIHKFADTKDYRLIEIYEDVASGVGAKSFLSRKGLQSALDVAARNGADLIVWEWDRLSRFATFKDQITEAHPDLGRVICAKDGSEMSDASNAAVLEHSERTAREISRRTKAGMEKKRAEGVVFGNPDITTAVQPLGSAAFSKKADAIVRQIADILSKLDDPHQLTRSEIARLLNAKGLRTLQDKEWNASRVRKPLKKALLLLENEEGPESLPTYGLF